MTNSTGGGGYAGQARVAAEGKAGGPSMSPGRGPVDRKDKAIVVTVLTVLGAILAFLILG